MDGMEKSRIFHTQGILGNHSHVIQIFLSFLLLFSVAYTQEVLKVSQCFKSRGIPQVSLGCPGDHMIRIQRAFHGISDPSKNLQGGGPGAACRPNEGQESTNCSYCPGDCIDDSMNLVYDWSTCMGNTSCVRTVMQSYMPACPAGRDKFSQYLQVEYQCVPKSEVLDICSATQKWLSSGHVTSPGYPEHYPAALDCLCTLQTDWNSRIKLSFYDLLLETKQGRCRADWLMLRQSTQKHRHCGAIMTGTKNITSESNSLTLQLHTDLNDSDTQNFQYFSRRLKGIWLHFAAEPAASVQVLCRRLTSDDPEVKEIQADDADYTQVLPPGSGEGSSEGGGVQDGDVTDMSVGGGYGGYGGGESQEYSPQSTEKALNGTDNGENEINNNGSDSRAEQNQVDAQENTKSGVAALHRTGALLALLASLLTATIVH